MARKLHIGGSVAHPEWEVMDAIPGPHVDHVGDARDLSRFPDQTFATVYASHVLEHFAYRDALPETLREWRRVLQPGGKLYTSVPDLDTLAALFLKRDQLTLAERFHVMRMMFGGQTTPYDYHYVGINFEILCNFLGNAGFTTAERVERFGLFNDTSTLRFKGVPVSLNVIACR